MPAAALRPGPAHSYPGVIPSLLASNSFRGDLRTLKDILGHSDITTTMIYAHLAPEHLDKAFSLDPLSSVRSYAASHFSAKVDRNYERS